MNKHSSIYVCFYEEKKQKKKKKKKKKKKRQQAVTYLLTLIDSVIPLNSTAASARADEERERQYGVERQRDRYEWLA